MEIMKKTIIAIICLIVLICAGVYGYFHFQRKNEAKYLDLATEYRKDAAIVAYSTQVILLDYLLSGYDTNLNGCVISNMHKIPVSYKQSTNVSYSVQIRKNDYSNAGVLNKIQGKFDRISKLILEMRSVCPSKYEYLQKELDKNFSVLSEYYNLLDFGQYSLPAFADKCTELISIFDKTFTATAPYIKVNKKKIKEIIKEKIIGIDSFMCVAMMAANHNYQGNIYVFY